MIDNGTKQYIQGEISKAQKNALYSTKNVASHTHNGIDAPKLPLQSTEAGVSSIIAGTNVTISPSGGRGDVTVNASTTSGVTSLTAGTGIGVSASTGAVTVSNTGVTSIVAGSNITISGGTGAVTINSTGSGGTTYIASSGVSSWTLNTSGTLIIPHGIGVVPEYIRIMAHATTGGSGDIISNCSGVYSNNTTSGTFQGCSWNTVIPGSSAFAGIDSSHIIYVAFDNTPTGQLATLGSLTTTDFSLTFAPFNSGVPGNVYFTWEASATY